MDNFDKFTLKNIGVMFDDDGVIIAEKIRPRIRVNVRTGYLSPVLIQSENLESIEAAHSWTDKMQPGFPDVRLAWEIWMDDKEISVRWC